MEILYIFNHSPSTLMVYSSWNSFPPPPTRPQFSFYIFPVNTLNFTELSQASSILGKSKIYLHLEMVQVRIEWRSTKPKKYHINIIICVIWSKEQGNQNMRRLFLGPIWMDPDVFNFTAECLYWAGLLTGFDFQLIQKWSKSTLLYVCRFLMIHTNESVKKSAKALISMELCAPVFVFVFIFPHFGFILFLSFDVGFELGRSSLWTVCEVEIDAKINLSWNLSLSLSSPKWIVDFLNLVFSVAWNWLRFTSFTRQ